MIEQFLRNLNVRRVFQAEHRFAFNIRWVLILIIRNSWYNPNKCLFISIEKINESKITFVYSRFDSYPLMNLESLFFKNLASFHDFCHFINRNHRNTFHHNSTQSLNNLFNVLRLESFTINYSWTKLGFKNVKNT